MTENEDFALPDELQNLYDSLSKLRPSRFDPAMPDMLYAAGFAAGFRSKDSSQNVTARKSRNERVFAFVSGVSSGLLATILLGVIVYSLTNNDTFSVRSEDESKTRLWTQQDSEAIDDDVLVETQSSLTVNDQHTIPGEVLDEEFDVHGLSPVMQRLASQQLAQNEILPQPSHHMSDSNHLHDEPLRRLSVWEEIR